MKSQPESQPVTGLQGTLEKPQALSEEETGQGDLYRSSVSPSIKEGLTRCGLASMLHVQGTILRKTPGSQESGLSSKGLFLCHLPFPKNKQLLLTVPPTLLGAQPPPSMSFT
jgi:hypothetical protein